MIDKDSINRLRHLPIGQVADTLGMGIRGHKALCPFHDDSHPSLHLSATHNSYHCYVCGAHGGPIDLVMHRQNLPFHEACHWLARVFGVYIKEESGSRGKESQQGFADRSSRRLKLFRQACAEEAGSSASPVENGLPKEVRPAVVDVEYLSLYVRHPVLSPEAERFLFEDRKLRRDVIEWCRVSSISQPTPCTRFGRPFYNAPSLLIPYFDGEGKLQSVQSRYLGSAEEAKANGLPRFRFPKGSQCHIYNLPILRWLQPGEPLFITEGCTDCWSMMSMGRKAIAIPSATLLKPADIAPLRHLNLHIFPDQDAPGERLFLELKDLLPQLERHQLPDGCKDFSDYYQRMVSS